MDSLPIRACDGPLSRPLHRTRIWVEMDAGVKKRKAAKAARDLDEEVLADLTVAISNLLAQATGGISENTARSYRAGVRVFLDFARLDGVSILRPAHGADLGRLFVQALVEEGAKPATVQVRLAAARKLYSALRWAGVTDADPFEGVSAPKDMTAPMDKRREYTREEVERLLDVAGPRETVAVLLGALSGLRISEAAALTWEDVDLSASSLVVRQSKRRRSREVTIGKSLVAALQSLAASARGGEEPSGRVLGLQARGLRAAFDRLALKAGVDSKGRGFHSLRHTAGHRVFSRLNDLGNVAEHLGHASLDTARRYAKRSDALRKEVADW